jgi:uncharacterized protein involved in exopolysaccharide biosynthesis
MSLNAMFAALIRFRASRLPTALALRLEEEWLSELNSISSGPGKFAFAVALLLTRRRAFVAPGENIVSEVATLGSRKSLVILSTAVFAIAAYGASFLVPVKYESEAVVQNRDRDDLVLMKVSSRSLVESVVEELHLEPRDRMIEELRTNIEVDPVLSPSNSGSIFRVKYRAADPTIARTVATKLVERLIGQDMGQRFEMLQEEERFLERQLDALAHRVQDKGNELAYHRARGEATSNAGAMLALDHELLVSSYKDLFAKHQDVQRAASLVESRLRIVDQPELGSERGPNRPAYAGIGAFVGLAMGGLAVVGLGRKQRRLLTKAV